MELKIYVSQPAYSQSYSTRIIVGGLPDSKLPQWFPVPGCFLPNASPTIRWLTLLWLLGISLLKTEAARGQTFRPEFKHLSTSDGLLSSNVNGILQDRQGMMWFATEGGLNRYDGYQFTSYPDGTGSSHTWVLPGNLFEDQSGAIWVSFANGGAARYNPETETFAHYFRQPHSSGSLSNDLVTCFYQTRSGSFWVGTQEGLNLYQSSANSFRPYFIDKNPKGLANHITTILEDRQGHLWVGTQHGLYWLESKTGKFHPFYTDPAESKFSKAPRWHNWISRLYEDSQGMIWVGTNGLGLWQLKTNGASHPALFTFTPCLQEGLHYTQITFIWETPQKELWVGTQTGVARLKSTAGQEPVFERYLHEPARFNKYGNHPILHFYADRRGQLWIASQTSLYLFDRQQNSFFPIRHNPNDPKSLSSNAINCIYEDRTGVLWFGTVKGGLNLLNNRQNFFQHFRHIPNDPNSLDHRDVYSILEDRQGILWFGTYTGLNRFDPKTGRFAVFRRKPPGHRVPLLEAVGAIAEDPAGYLLVGYFDGQLSQFFPEKKEFVSYDYHPLVPNSNISWSIRTLLQDGTGTWWIGACTAGLGKWNSVTKAFTYYMPDSSNYVNSSVRASPSQTINDVQIHSLHESKNGILWIGTFRGGLNRFDRKNGTFRHCQHNPANLQSPSSNTINVIYEDSTGYLWLGTSGGGLNRFDPRTETWKHFTTTQGLSGNTVNGVLDDGKGHLWLSTNQGISRFNPRTGTFRNFHEADGLQSEEFIAGAYFRSRSGWMYFGGVNGITAFHPDSITELPETPKVLITSFSIFNEPVAVGKPLRGTVFLHKSINQTREITISYRENTFSLGFVGLHYAAPGTLQYAYQLEGFRSEWTYVDAAQRITTYTNLPPGQYNFRVKASGSNGHWSPVTAIRIRITPPLWATWWFRTLACLVVAAGLLLFYRMRTRNLRQQKQQLEQEVASRTREVMLQKKEIEIQRDSLEEQYKNIRLLSEIGQNITASIHLADIFEIVYAHVNEWMEAPSFGIGLVNREEQSVEYLSKSGPGQPITRDILRVDDPERLSSWCIRNAEPVFLNEVSRQIGKYLHPYEERYLREDSPKSLIYLPLQSRGEPVTGVLVVKCFREQAYSDVHLNLLKNLASYIAIALDNASAYRSILRQKDQIEQMAQRIHEADQQKMHFFTSVSHEFRTPLTLIVSPLERLLSGSGKHDGNTLALHQLMHRNAQRLLRLVNQLTDWRKLEGGAEKIQPQWGNLGSFVAELAGQFREVAAEHQITLTTEIIAGYGWFDPDKVEKIVYNLLSNAFKHTPAGGKVAVTVHAPNQNHDSSSGGATIAVADTGVGISPDHLPHIFDLFYNVENKRNSFPHGLGIGLSLTKELVTLHGGTISVESTVKEGTCFTVYLPLQSMVIPHVSPLDVEATVPENHFHFTTSGLLADGLRERTALHSDEKTGTEVPNKILIVEDNPDIRRYLRMNLQSYYQTVEAADGAEGLSMALQHLPDLIISDIRMPQMDGMELCHRLKTDQRTSHIPVILLTAHSGEETHLQGLETGADDYLSKPFNISLLEARIRNLVHSRNHLRKCFAAASHEELSQLGNNAAERSFMEKITQLIESNLNDPEFDGELLGREIGMSRSTLYRKLKAVTGLSIQLFIRSVRLKKAAYLLRSGEYTVSEVAYLVGFNDPAYFSRCFSEAFSQSPTQYSVAGPLGKGVEKI